MKMAIANNELDDLGQWDGLVVQLRASALAQGRPLTPPPPSPAPAPPSPAPAPPCRTSPASRTSAACALGTFGLHRPHR
jgi:hypothetical protein